MPDGRDWFPIRRGGFPRGEHRKDTHKEDLAALKLLAERGYDAKLRAHLAGLVKLVRGKLDDEARATLAAGPDAADRAHLRDSVALYHWYREWAAIARIAVPRRDHQIRLGIASRKVKKKKAPVAAPAAAK